MSIIDLEVYPDAIRTYLEQENEKDPLRTQGPFDLLMRNLNTVLYELIKNKERQSSVVISLHLDKRIATVFNDPIILHKGKYLFVFEHMKNKPPAEQIYRLFTGAEDFAKKRDANGELKYQDFFRKIVTEA